MVPAVSNPTEPTLRDYFRRADAVVAFCYQGTFPLSFLRDGETVRAAPLSGRGACEVCDASGGMVVFPGWWLLRDDEGLSTMGDDSFRRRYVEAPS